MPVKHFAENKTGRTRASRFYFIGAERTLSAGPDCRRGLRHIEFALVRLGEAALLHRADLLGAAALGGLDGQDRPAAFRARLVERQVPNRVLAIRVARARIEDLAVARLALEHVRLLALRAQHAGIGRFFQRLHVLAVRVIAATDELAVAAALDDQVGFALRALAIRHDLGLVAGAGGLVHVARIVAVGIAGAADEVAVAAEAFRQLLAALRAFFLHH